jgi:hypothetical protein
MSKATTKARIQAEITNALVNDSITPVIVGSILDEILELDTTPYKVYSAVLSQAGVNSPTALVFEDSILGITLVRKSIGNYTFAKNGGFPMGKTFFTHSNSSWNSNSNSTTMAHYDADEIWICTSNSDQSMAGILGFSDLNLENTCVEIRVYN